MTSNTNISRLIAIVALSLVLLPGLQQTSPAAAPARELSRITVSFKLDQRLSGPTYGAHAGCRHRPIALPRAATS